MKLLLKFKERSHLKIRAQILDLTVKYALTIEESFEVDGRPTPTVNMVVSGDIARIEEVILALKRIPSILVSERK